MDFAEKLFQIRNSMSSDSIYSFLLQKKKKKWLFIYRFIWKNQLGDERLFSWIEKTINTFNVSDMPKEKYF